MNQSFDLHLQATLRVRHKVLTRHIVELNGCLKSFQKECLKATPFKWIMDMVDHVIIFSPILLELINKWDVGQKAFRIKENLVSFTIQDVCFS